MAVLSSGIFGDPKFINGSDAFFSTVSGASFLFL